MLSNPSLAITGTGNFDNLVDYTTNTLKKHNTDIVADRKQTKKAAKKLKKEYTLFGRVPRFFQVTKDEILNQGQMQGFFNALAKTDESVENAVVNVIIFLFSKVFFSKHLFSPFFRGLACFFHFLFCCPSVFFLLASSPAPY